MRYATLKDDGSTIETDDPIKAYSTGGRFIKQEHYKDFYISTVFLPMDHSFGNEPPVHFETYVFPSDGKNVTSWGELWGERSHTRDEALEVHEKARALIDNGEITK